MKSQWIAVALLCFVMISQAGPPKPRDHHYGFAHRTLVFEMRFGEEFLIELEETGDELLKELWSYAGEDADDGIQLPSTGLSYEITDLGEERKVVIVKLPEPKVVTEAYFVGCIIEGKVPSLIYTLEKGRRNITLAGWSGQSHVNFGEGPEPSFELFLAAIIERSK